VVLAVQGVVSSPEPEVLGDRAVMAEAEAGVLAAMLVLAVTVVEALLA
jgi:hypothetical protein